MFLWLQESTLLLKNLVQMNKGVGFRLRNGLEAHRIAGSSGNSRLL